MQEIQHKVFFLKEYDSVFTTPRQNHKGIHVVKLIVAERLDMKGRRLATEAQSLLRISEQSRIVALSSERNRELRRVNHPLSIVN
jgi:hypothetical protein